MKACLISPDKPFVLVSELEPKLLMSISAVTSALYTANRSWESIVFSIQPHKGWTFMVKSLWIMEWDVQWVTSTWRERGNMFQRGCCGHIQHNVIYSSRTWTLFLDQHSLLFLKKKNISVHLNLLLKLSGCCKSILENGGSSVVLCDFSKQFMRGFSVDLMALLIPAVPVFGFTNMINAYTCVFFVVFFLFCFTHFEYCYIWEKYETVAWIKMFD